MPTAHRTPSVGVTRRAPHETDTELLVVPLFEDDDLADLGWLDAAAAEDVARARGRGELKGKPYDAFVTAVGTDGRRAALIGAGRRAGLTADHLRRITI